ncbi:MAG: hypothetical protein WD767_05075 [Alphaproteobacteria bacterium]
MTISFSQRLRAGMLAFGVIAAPAMMLGGCEEQGPAEQAGEAIDEGVQDTKRAVEDAKD